MYIHSYVILFTLYIKYNLFATVFDYQRLFHTDYSFPEEIYDSVKFIVTAVKAPPPSTVKKEQRDTANVNISWLYM